MADKRPQSSFSLREANRNHRRRQWLARQTKRRAKPKNKLKTYIIEDE